MCQRCGTDVSYVATQSQQRTTELESQVRLLTDKATAAGKLTPLPIPILQLLLTLRALHELTPPADKLADYEDELRRLKTTSPYATSFEPTTHNDPPSRPPSALQSRISALLPSSSKRSLSQPPASPSHPSPPGAFPAQDPTDLLAALTHETSLRHAAESRFSKSQEEIEELSTQLFAEANEMVAEERRERKRLEDERKRLEERVQALEKVLGEKQGKVEVLEKRAREKEGRWEELERRVRRGERVRGLLAQTGGGGGGGVEEGGKG